MLKRIYTVFVIVSLFCVFSLYAQDCQIDSYDSECIIFDSPYNIFNLDISDENDLDSFNARIFNKNNRGNEIQVSIESNSIKNLDPFTEPGVYVLEVIAYNRRKNHTVKEFEFIFDNSNSKPPVIEPSLRVNANTITIMGYANPLYSVVAQSKSGEVLREVRPDENGVFSLELSNRNSNNRALVYFYSNNTNGIKSDTIERIIYFEEESPSNEQNVENITISDLSSVPNTVKASDNSYFSKKRNFYVEGTLSSPTQKGVPVYINGNKVLSAGDNTFAGFVLLNKGENILEIKTKDASTSVNVTYLNVNFRFTSNPLEDFKIVSQDTVTINGNTNMDLPVNVYVNGENINSVVLSDRSYSVEISDLKPGKNYVYIEGYNGEYISGYIYYDTQEPQIELVSGTSFLNGTYNLVFKITDDTGVDLETMNVSINGVKVSTNKIQRVSNYYMVNLENYQESENSYEVVARDRASKLSSISGTFSINPRLTAIERIDFDGRSSKRIGNHLFLGEGMNGLVLYFSENIAFESIRLDGREVVDYNIRSDNSVDLRLNISEPSGDLELRHINSNRDVFTSNFKYYSSIERPVLKLNYIDKSSYGQGSFARVSGQIIDSSFNYSSLSVGGSNNYVLYGNYFEAIFSNPANRSDLRVRGYDVSDNAIKKVLPIFYDDSSNDVKLDRYSKLISGRVDGYSKETNSLIYSYEASNSNPFVISDERFELSPVDWLGIRTPLLRGIESSRNPFDSYGEIISVDNMKPKVYFISNGGGVNVLIDGTFSNIDANALSILVDGNSSSLGGCSGYERISLHDECYFVDGGTSRRISVNVSDMAGNSLYKDFRNTLNANPTRAEIDFKIYFNGNDLLTNADKGVVQGQITSKSVLTDVIINGDICYFDDFSFVCFVDLSRGSNSFTLNARNWDGEETEKEIVITRDDSLSIEIIGLSQSGIPFDISDVQFADNFNVFIINGTVDRDVSVSTLINGCCQENSKEPKSKGEFTIELDISQRVFGKNEDEFNVSLRAVDDLGNEATSNKIKFVFERVFNTIVQIFVG